MLLFWYLHPFSVPLFWYLHPPLVPLFWFLHPTLVCFYFDTYTPLVCSILILTPYFGVPLFWYLHPTLVCLYFDTYILLWCSSILILTSYFGVPLFWYLHPTFGVPLFWYLHSTLVCLYFDTDTLLWYVSILILTPYFGVPLFWYLHSTLVFLYFDTYILLWCASVLLFIALANSLYLSISSFSCHEWAVSSATLRRVSATLLHASLYDFSVKYQQNHITIWIIVYMNDLRTQNWDIFYLTLLIHYQNYCCKYIHISYKVWVREMPAKTKYLSLAKMPPYDMLQFKIELFTGLFRIKICEVWSYI